MRLILPIISDLQELLLKLGSQVRRDCSEVIGLQKKHSHPRRFITNTLTIIYKQIERYTEEKPLSIEFMKQEDWDALEERPPLYTGIVSLHGVENLLHGIPIFCLSVNIYFKGTHSYTVLYEPTSEMFCGVQVGNGVYVLGGKRLRVITQPDSEEIRYAWVSSSTELAPHSLQNMLYTPRSVAIALLWTIMSRTSAAVIETKLLTPAAKLITSEIECTIKETSTFTIFGEKASVEKVYELLESNSTPLT